jgi:hypothetical protein
MISNNNVNDMKNSTDDAVWDYLLNDNEDNNINKIEDKKCEQTPIEELTFLDITSTKSLPYLDNNIQNSSIKITENDVDNSSDEEEEDDDEEEDIIEMIFSRKIEQEKQWMDKYIADQQLQNTENGVNSENNSTYYNNEKIESKKDESNENFED